MDTRIEKQSPGNWMGATQRIPLSIPELSLISATRGMLGAGVGMLVAGMLTDDQRKAVGWTLLAVGAMTTVPIIAQLASSQARSSALQHAHTA
jgi:hypothetical protein